MPDVSKCSSCGRPIIWAASPNGARLPLDARAATAYCLDNATPPNAVVVEAYVIKQPANMFDAEQVLEAPKIYVSHFLACPNAAEHSRARK